MMVQPEELFSPAIPPQFKPSPAISPSHHNESNENVPPGRAWVAVFRVMNVTCDFLFFISHPAINFETIASLVLQNEQTSTAELFLYPVFRH